MRSKPRPDLARTPEDRPNRPRPVQSDADRVTMRCSACWAALRVNNHREVKVCPWCGTESSHHFGRVSTTEPICEPPQHAGNPRVHPSEWTPQACLHGLLNETDDLQRRAIADVLSAQLTTEATASHAGVVVLAMYDASPELDVKLGHILERIAWFGGLAGRQQVLLSCHKHAFLLPESTGILRALASLRVASLRLLVDVATHAELHGMHQRTIEALSELRLVLDFERGDDLMIGLDILFAMLPKAEGFVQAWLQGELSRRILALHDGPHALEQGSTQQRQVFAHIQWLTYLNPNLSDALVGGILEAKKDKAHRLATRRFLHSLHQYAPGIAIRYQPARRINISKRPGKPMVMILAACAFAVSALIGITFGLQTDTLTHHGSGTVPSPSIHAATVSLVSLFSRSEPAPDGARGRSQLPPARDGRTAGPIGDARSMGYESIVSPGM